MDILFMTLIILIILISYYTHYTDRRLRI